MGENVIEVFVHHPWSAGVLRVRADFVEVTLESFIERVQEFFDDESSLELYIAGFAPGQRTRLDGTAELEKWLEYSQYLPAVECWVMAPTQTSIMGLTNRTFANLASADHGLEDILEEDIADGSVEGGTGFGHGSTDLVTFYRDLYGT